MSLLESLNPEQRAAVTLPRQSALILAGAGSGKTRVLTTRIAYLIQSGQANPHGILAVTFTNKAAKEMLTRLSAMLPINTRGMWMGTFHGLCNRFLRTHHREAGLPQSFQILDAQDQLSVVKRVLKSANADTERFEPRRVQQFIVANKEAGLRAERVVADDPFTRRMVEFFDAYERQCEREGVTDFSELMLRTHEVLARTPSLLEHYRNRFSHILVDEFQDTSEFQYAWLRLLAGDAGTVFAVGDDDQSIYAFRGAHTGNMRDFERDFAVETVIRLEQNYRSHGNILDAANALIRLNRERLGKNLWTAEGKGEPIRVFRAPTDALEAQFIVDEARSAMRGGVTLAETAVLYRSNAQSRVIEHALFSAGVPYRVYGGLRFFERQEIKHALAYLRLIANAEDDNAFLRVVNLPARGIGARTLESLSDAARLAGTSLWQVACRTGSKGKDSARGVPAFVNLVERLRQETAGLSLSETVAHIIPNSGLEAYYRAEKDGADRLANLEELVNAALVFESEAEVVDDAGGMLATFLAHAALEAGEHQAGEGRDALQLMTVHAAKGLEFHAVFVTGLEEGLFPHEQSMFEHGGLEEERRLMYVAMTRARRRLYLSWSESRMLHGQIRYGVSSRFLAEIPHGLLRHVNALAGETVAASARDSSASGWRVGMNVRHPKFGEGTIVACEGRGEDARVQVNFLSGMKWLAVAYANLVQA